MYVVPVKIPNGQKMEMWDFEDDTNFKLTNISERGITIRGPR